MRVYIFSSSSWTFNNFCSAYSTSQNGYIIRSNARSMISSEIT
uniref:Uncharacterized protein n=1 Tax=Glycine max TaxID=3847 RepID=C6T737_SOYBN|nr:unknown [Glycine max]